MSKSRQLLGIYGGTFDPIHLGHIEPVRAAAKWLELAQVRMLPAHIPPHKTSTAVNSDHRAAMVDIFCQQDSLFISDLRELKRLSPSYTYDTLQEFIVEFNSSTLVLFIGMDSLLNFTSWYRWQQILELCHLVVSTRPGYKLSINDAPNIAPLIKHITTDKTALDNKNSGAILLAPAYDYPMSSSQLRMHFNQPHQCQPHIPEVVWQYIEKHQLYR